MADPVVRTDRKKPLKFLYQVQQSKRARRMFDWLMCRMVITRMTN